MSSLGPHVTHNGDNSTYFLAQIWQETEMGRGYYKLKEDDRPEVGSWVGWLGVSVPAKNGYQKQCCHSRGGPQRQC